MDEIEHPTPAAVPYLAVRDARVAINWYATVFGATVEGDPYLGETAGSATRACASAPV